MIIIECDQGSDEWFAERLQRVTGSRIADVIAKTRSGYGASRANYAAEKVIEHLTGQTPEGYTSPAMERGTMLEPEARATYSFMKGVDVKEVGLVIHPNINMASASPDGLIGDTEGCLEIKCPQPKAHIQTLLSEKIDARYVCQIQWQLACTGLPWADYVSYNPDMPPEMQLFIKRVERDDETIENLENEVRLFLEEVSETVDNLQRKFPALETAA